MKIEFNGEVTGKSRKFLLRKYIKWNFIGSSVVVFISLICVIALTFYLNSKYFVFGIFYLLILLCTLLPPTKKAQKDFMPLRIWFDFEEGTVVHQSEKKNVFI